MNKHDLNNKIFIIILVVMSFIFLLCIFRNKQTINTVDNRSSYKFKLPTIKTLLNSEYQNSMDDTIADQMPKYEYFKLLYLKLNYSINISTINALKLYKKDRYIKFGNDVYLYKDYLVYRAIPLYIDESNITEINKLVDETNANIYLYYINSDENYDFETGYMMDDAGYLKKHLKVNYMASFDVEDFNEYKEYFYRTDHHWNYKGSYKGFIDIANLMNLDVPEPTNEICFNSKFDGTKIKNLAGINIVNDTACMYQFSLPEFRIYINGEEVGNYGATIDELGNMESIRYIDMYGTDYAEIEFVNYMANNDKKLLIYSNSFSNAINKLLASNYRETYVIDGRYYDKESMVDYINDHNIDDVLILANHMFLWNNMNW